MLATWFVILWVIVYGGTSWFTGLHTFRLSVAMEWEHMVPFVPAMAVLYLSLIPMMMLPMFIFRAWQDLVPLLAVLVAETLVAAVCFVLLPMERAFPEHSVSGFFNAAFSIADAVNLEFNEMPSLHVAYAITTASAIGRRCRAFGRYALVVWAGGIAISSLFIHQHQFVDIIAGAALAYLTMHWMYEKAADPAFLRRIRTELDCIAEIYNFSRRHLRYLLVGLLIYWHSLFRWNDLRGIRVGFCLLQHIDDILDGDRACAVEPLEVVDGIVRQMESGAFGDNRPARLARCLWEEMGHFQTGDDDPRGEVVILIRLMQYDRARVRDRLLLERSTLYEHHRRTFHHAVNLMLMLGHAELRARDAPDLIEAFGWCSMMRDLREDLEKGLVNLPASVVNAARSQGLVAVEYSAVVKMPAVKQWFLEDYRRAMFHLNRFESELRRLGGKRGVAILKMFHKSIRRFAVKAAKQYGWESLCPNYTEEGRYVDHQADRAG